jgi:hypothetical protein
MNHPVQWSWSRWPSYLRRPSGDIRLLGLWVRIPPGTWISVFSESFVLSGRGLCVGLITHLEESYWALVWVSPWSLHNGEALAHEGLLHHAEKEHGNTNGCLNSYYIFVRQHNSLPLSVLRIRKVIYITTWSHMPMNSRRFDVRFS